MSVLKLLRFAAVFALLCAFTPASSYAQSRVGYPDFSFIEKIANPPEKKTEPTKKAPAPVKSAPPPKPAPAAKKQVPPPATKPAIPTKPNSETAAQAPCINCFPESAGKTKNQKDIADFLEQNSADATTSVIQVKSSLNICYTCGKVDPEKLRKAQLEAVAQKHSLKDFPEIEAYSNSSEVEKMIAFAKKKAFKVSKLKCYRAVKNALHAGTLTPSQFSLNGSNVFPETAKKGSGKNAVDDLKDFGFINMLDEKHGYSKFVNDPSSAPKGAILVYKGGTNGGHIEIKGENDLYVSDYKSSKPILLTDWGRQLAGTKNAYKLVGVMIKKPENL